MRVMPLSGHIGFVAGLLLSLLLLACADDESGAASEPDWPRAIGVPQIDAALTALEAGNWDAFRRQIPWALQPCTTALGAGGPPKCASGVADGTVVKFLPYFQCDGWDGEEGLRARLLDESARPLAVIAYPEPGASIAFLEERAVTYALLMMFDGYGGSRSDARLLTVIQFGADGIVEAVGDCGAYSLEGFEAGQLPVPPSTEVLWQAYPIH